MNREQFTDRQLIDAILKGGDERDRALKYLFHHDQYRTMVADIVAKGGGNDAYGKLIFENCLILLDNYVRRKKYQAETLGLFFEKEARLAWCRELVANTKARDNLLIQLTIDKELKGKIHALVVKNRGSLEDARDVYQNGLILTNDYVKDGKFRGGAVKGFFYQVCYNLWRNELKRSKAISLPEDGLDVSITIVDPQKELERKEFTSTFNKIFELLGESCQKILRLKFFIVEQYTMEEIAQQMGFKNAQIASNTLSKCRKRLLSLLQEQTPSFKWNRNISIG